jgi:RimJ/RimL family protein N-acetyltransferase
MDLVGDSILLRAPRSADAPALLAIRADPDVARFSGPPHLPTTTLERVRESLVRRTSEHVRWIVEALPDGGLIGSGVLYRMDHRNRNCWLAIEIGPPARWGRGHGTETARLLTRFAFRQLAMEKVYATVYEGNVRALRAAARAGYEVEAALGRHHLLHGRLVTEYWLAAYRDHELYT